MKGFKCPLNEKTASSPSSAVYICNEIEVLVAITMIWSTRHPFRNMATKEWTVTKREHESRAIK